MEGKKAAFPQPYKLSTGKKPNKFAFGPVNDQGLYEPNGDDPKL